LGCKGSNSVIAIKRTVNYNLSTNNLTVSSIPQNFNLYVIPGPTDFFLRIDSDRQLKLRNFFDTSNFYNCYLSAYEFKGTKVNKNPIYVSNFSTISANNGKNYTFYYYSTGLKL